MFVLTKLFGDYYQAKIIECFLENYDEELSTPEIIEMAETSRGSSYKYLEYLVSEGIIKKTRKIGKTQLHQLNSKHPLTKVLIELEHLIFKSGIEKFVKKVPELEPKYHGEPLVIIEDKNGMEEKHYSDGYTETTIKGNKIWKKSTPIDINYTYYLK